MIITSNLSEVVRRAKESERVLDLGGWYRPLNAATHVIDINPFETRRKHEPLDPENAERFTAETWYVQDACVTPWPFEDKFFDFSFCSHLLEDIRDPLAVCRELIRVAKSGYIETPSRDREIFSKARFFALKAAFGRMPAIGFDHHRWFCELEGGHWRFIPKDQRLFLSRKRFLTRGDIGRKLSEKESGVYLFWTDAFTFEEAFDEGEESLAAYRRDALKRLKASPPV